MATLTFVIMDPAQKVVHGSIRASNRAAAIHLVRSEAADLKKGLPEKGFSIMELVRDEVFILPGGGIPAEKGSMAMVHIRLRREKYGPKPKPKAPEAPPVAAKPAPAPAPTPAPAPVKVAEPTITVEAAEEAVVVRPCAICGKPLRETQKKFCGRDCFYKSLGKKKSKGKGRKRK